MPEQNRQPKLLLTLFCTIIFILGFEIGGFQLALLRSANELGFDGAIMGLPISIQFISLSFFPLVFGPISDKIGKKTIIMIFMAVFTVGCFFIWMSSSISEFLVGIFVMSAGLGVCESSLTAAISDTYPEKGENYINLSQSFLCIGAIISPLVLQTLMDERFLSWRINFLICAISMAAVIPLLIPIKMKTVTKGKHTKDNNRKENPFLIFGFIICIFIYIGIESSVSYFADTIFTLELNAPAYGAYAISFFWAAMAAGRFYFGRINKIPTYAVAISLFVLGIVLVCIIFFRQEVVMLVLFTAAGLACSCIWPGIVNSAFSLKSSSSGKIMSYLYLGSGIGGMLIPLIFGAIMNLSNMSYSFLLLTVLSFGAGAYMWKNTKKESITE